MIKYIFLICVLIGTYALFLPDPNYTPREWCNECTEEDPCPVGYENVINGMTVICKEWCDENGFWWREECDIRRFEEREVEI